MKTPRWGLGTLFIIWVHPVVLVKNRRRCSVSLTAVLVLGQRNKQSISKVKVSVTPFEREIISFISKWDANTLWDLCVRCSRSVPADTEMMLWPFFFLVHSSIPSPSEHTYIHPKVTEGSRAPKLRRPRQIGSKRLIYSEPSWMDCAVTV